MGTTELAVPKVIEILAPEGEYEKKRIALRSEYSAVLAESKKIKAIETSEQAEAATKFGRLLQTASKETATFFTGVKQMIDSIKKPVLAAEKDDVNPYENEKARLGNLLTKFQLAERQRVAEEERQARIKAEQDAESERLSRSLELAASGEMEAAETVMEEPIVAAPVVVAATETKFTGSVSRKSYSCEVENLMELVKAVAAGKVLLAAIQPDTSWLNQKARNEKEGFYVPGCKLHTEESTGFRA